MQLLGCCPRNPAQSRLGIVQRPYRPAQVAGRCLDQSRSIGQMQSIEANRGLSSQTSRAERRALRPLNPAEDRAAVDVEGAVAPDPDAWVVGKITHGAHPSHV